jgi:hypothetical protein
VRTVSCEVYLAIKEGWNYSIVVTTDPREWPDATAKEAGMSGTDLLTERQIRCIEKLPGDQKVMRVRHGVPIVRQSDGRLLRMDANGRLVMTIPVEMVQSYLHVRG